MHFSHFELFHDFNPNKVETKKKTHGDDCCPSPKKVVKLPSTTPKAKRILISGGCLLT